VETADLDHDGARGDSCVVASIAILIAAFVAALAVTGLALRLARSRGLYASPNARSSHTRPTPTAGGIGIVVPVLGAAAWFGGAVGNVVLVGGSALALVGLVDDWKNLPARVRAPVQVGAVAVALLWLPLPPLVLPPLVIETAWLVLPISGLLLLWLLNLYNFMDGIDGLAASQCLTFCAGVLWLGPGDAEPLLWTAAGAAAGFLVFNWPPARIFLGDVASHFLGFLLGVVAFDLAVRGALPFVASMVLLTGFWFDATYTLCARMFTGQRVFAAHRTHLYQKLARRYGHGRTTSGYLVMNVCWLTPLAWLAQARPSASIAVVGIAALPYLVGCVRQRAGRSEDV
jgi:Fuc2NAc and GlcNAc transferase